MGSLFFRVTNRGWRNVNPRHFKPFLGKVNRIRSRSTANIQRLPLLQQAFFDVFTQDWPGLTKLPPQLFKRVLLVDPIPLIVARNQRSSSHSFISFGTILVYL